MAALPAGIELHGKTLRICFSYRGVRCREALKGLDPTKANIKFAARKRAVILHEIAIGTFDYAAHFPNSVRVAKFSPQPQVVTVGEVLDNWLKIKAAKTRPVTYNDYRHKVDKYIRPAIGHLPITDVTVATLENLVYTRLAKLSNTTIRYILTLIGGALRGSVQAGLLKTNPVTLMDPLPALRQPPDPFLQQEIAAIVSTPTRYVSEVNQFVFCCWTGLRLSEAFGLAWEDIDIERGVASIKRGMVKGRYSKPKTKSSLRTLLLLDQAKEVLQQQYTLTYHNAPETVEVLQEDNKTRMAETLRTVFPRTANGGAYKDDLAYRVCFFIPHLEAAGVRYRSPKNARHTFASQLLTAGAPKEWIIQQMGHTSSKMFDTHYGKWITEEAPDMARLVSDLLRKSG